MEQTIGGIRALSRAILDDTKVEAEQIVVEAGQAAKSIVQRAKEEAEQIRENILRQSRNEAFHTEQRTLATARLDAQRVMLTRREQMLDLVFERAEAQLSSIHDSDQYVLMLRRLIADAVVKLGDPHVCVVRVTERDMDTLKQVDLEALSANWSDPIQFTIGDPVEITGGVIVETADGHKLYNNSFEARLSLERARLRAQVYQLLQGEA